MSSESTSLLEARIKLTERDDQLVQSLLTQWRHRQLLSPTLCSQLLDTIEVQDPRFDWQRLAKYTFRLALVCLIIAVITLIFDTAFLKLIHKILEINAHTRAAITAAVSIGIHYYAWRRSRRLPDDIWMNEGIHGVGAIVLSLAALQLAEAVGGLKMHNGGVIDIKGRNVMWLLACCYALIGVATQSTFIWSCSMLTMGIWTAFWVPARGTIDLFRANYPLRFVILGSVHVFVACCMSMHPRTGPLWSATRTWGLIYLLICGLWYGSAMNTFDRPWDRFWPAFWWMLAFTVAAAVCTWHGLKYDDAITRGFGLVSLTLDVYTRYFDFFWRSMYRPLFFAVLAASFALIGWGAERWRAKLTRGA